MSEVAAPGPKRPEYEPHDTLSALGYLAEEAAEVIHVVGKILRFGLFNYHPTTRETNRDQLARELRDLEVAIERARHFLLTGGD